MNPIPYTELSQNTFNPAEYNSDWQEVVETTSQAEANATIDGQHEATLQGLIPFNKVRSAMRWFLGFDYVDVDKNGNGTGFLKREMPVQHPTFPNLRCSSFSAKPFIPEVNEVTGSLIVNSLFSDTTGSGKKLQYANYDNALVTAKFSGFRYPFLGDSQVRPNSLNGNPVPPGWGGNEYKRFCYFDCVPKIETLSADNNSFLAFAETSAAVVGPPAVAAGPSVSALFPVPNAVLVGKTGFTVHWQRVPLNYVSYDPNGVFDIFNPSNITECLGYTNKYAFLDSSPETLLFEGAKFDFKQYWVPAIDGTSMFFVDVELDFSYFDPPNGNPTSVYRGWNLLPWRANGLWYRASRVTGAVFGVAALNGAPYIPSTDYTTIFSNPNFYP